MAQETELKLAFAPRLRNALRQHPLLAQAPQLGRTQTLVNTYFDTPEFALRKARVAVRTRKAGRRWLQTVKCAAASLGGLSSRPEWEQPYRDDQFDFSAVDEPATARLLARYSSKLLPVFTTTFKRETRSIQRPDGSLILAMIDNGEIEANGALAPISELELELASGDPAQLIALAIELAQHIPLLPENASKAERGFQLFQHESPSARRAKQIAWQAETSLEEAFKSLAYDLLNCWQANTAGALLGEDPEFTHQLRVALRRMRTLLRIFAPVLPPESAEDWQAQLGELAQQTGQQRDFDVLRSAIIEPAAREDAQGHCAAALARIELEAEAVRKMHESLLGGTRCGVQMLRLAAFLHDQRFAEQASLQDFAAKALSRLRKAVKRTYQLARESADDESLHRLRIRLKRLRYGLEFFASLYPSKSSKRYLQQLAKALDELGYLNDLAVADSKLAAWSEDSPPLQGTRAYLHGWHAAAAARTRRSALRRLGRLLETAKPWQH